MLEMLLLLSSPKPIRHMKFLAAFSLILCLFFSNLSQAQLEISNIAHFEDLKNTTTIVFMPASDTAKHLTYRKVLEKYWKLTPLKFISYNQYVQHKNKKGYSYLLFGDDRVSNGTSTSSYVYLELWMWATPDGTWENKKKRLLARMELYPDTETTYDPSLIYDYRFDTDGHIFNWSPGMLKNYIQMFQEHILQQQARKQMKYEVDTDGLLALKNQTLYIPDYCLRSFNSNLEETGTQDAESLMQRYPYKYEVIRNDELSEKILQTGSPLYYLLFVRSNADKYVAVVEAKSGKIIYSRFRPISYNLRAGDLRRLDKAIQKAGRE